MSSKKASARGMAYAAMFGAMTAVGAYITIPLQPVPITLQSLFANLAGALLGGYLGALSQVVYLLLGIIGLPVFAGGKAGLGVLLGPTGGYLIGFVIGTYLTGKITELKKKPGFILILLAMLAGNLVIYGLGITRLALVARLSLAKAVAAGVIPFLPGDFLKMVAAAVIATRLRNRIKL
ncbi:MAG: biotin transporter BioY [Thermacetogeniaceae bacterium]